MLDGQKKPKKATCADNAYSAAHKKADGVSHPLKSKFYSTLSAGVSATAFTYFSSSSSSLSNETE